MSAVLLAAVADTLAEHEGAWVHADGAAPQWACVCGWNITDRADIAVLQSFTHQAEGVVARLTELLPGLPAEDVAALIGGTVAYATLPPVHREGMPPVRGGVWWRARRVIGPWAPASRPAAEGGE